jgi:hypothetical protein
MVWATIGMDIREGKGTTLWNIRRQQTMGPGAANPEPVAGGEKVKQRVKQRADESSARLINTRHTKISKEIELFYTNSRRSASMILNQAVTSGS